MRCSVGAVTGPGTPVENASLLPDYRHGIPVALRDDAGKKGRMKVWNMVLVSMHLPALHLRHIPNAQRRHCAIGACLREQPDRSVVFFVPGTRYGPDCLHYSEPSGLPGRANRNCSPFSPASPASCSTTWCCSPATSILWGTLFPVITEYTGYSERDQRGQAVFRSREHSDRLVPATAHRHRAR